MRKIKNKIYIEKKFIGVHLAMVRANEGLLLVDCPLKVDETKEWLGIVGEYGTPRYMALLDAHPDRVLGARAIDLPLVAQDETLAAIQEWGDTYKGNQHPIGAEADKIKRITGVQRVAPDIVFTDQMEIKLGEVEFQFLHRPGPRSGSMWILLPREKIAFIGDTVVLEEPPYIGKADLASWMALLDELRKPAMDSYTLVTSQGGPVKRAEINGMARFLRKAAYRIEKFGKGKVSAQEVDLAAADLLKDFEVPGPRQDQALLRLAAGLTNLSTSL